jgi:hypothetical protein
MDSFDLTLDVKSEDERTTELVKEAIHQGEDSDIYLVKDENKSTEELYNYYKSLESVESVSYNKKAYLMADSVEPVEPNDNLFKDQWYHWDIYTPEAWTITKGSSSVKVAVIDTGYISHEDLNGNISGEYDIINNNNNAIDDDSYYNSEDNKKVSHGTHMAGLIGAIGDNNIGIAGVNWGVEIMPIKIFDDQAEGATTDYLIKAIDYAVKKNKIFAFDPSFRANLWPEGNKGSEIIRGLLAQSDFIKPSLDDAYHLYGQDHPENYLKKYHNDGAKIVILSLGKDGVLLSDGSTEPLHLPVFSEKVVDVTGAGDSFWSGFLTGILKGLPINEAAKLGNAVAAFKIQGVGALSSVPPLSEIISYYDIQPIEGGNFNV